VVLCCTKYGVLYFACANCIHVYGVGADSYSLHSCTLVLQQPDYKNTEPTDGVNSRASSLQLRELFFLLRNRHVSRGAMIMELLQYIDDEAIVFCAARHRPPFPCSLSESRQYNYSRSKLKATSCLVFLKLSAFLEVRTLYQRILSPSAALVARIHGHVSKLESNTKRWR
jgi:hypothetical protein